MGVLDAIFGGANGLTATLFSTLGAKAVLKVETGSTRLASDGGRLVKTYDSFDVDFVPNVRENSTNRPEIPDANADGLRRRKASISGAISAANCESAPRPNRDLLEAGGVEYRLVRVDSTVVGNAVCSYEISGEEVFANALIGSLPS